MNTNDIREIIETKISEESSTGRLRGQLKHVVGKHDAGRIIEFIEDYLRMAPDLMDKVFAMAKQHGVIDHFQAVFDTIFNYWFEEYDFIPDNAGLVGICDDAYLTLALMHMVANTRVKGGSVLLANVDLSQLNNDMKKILGPQISSQLDATVNATYQSINIQNTIAALANLFNGGMPFGNSFAAIQSMVNQQRISDAVDTQLGAMGIF
jgi:uncharacterized membrane protein YkvA (DUF1232 family)